MHPFRTFRHRPVRLRLAAAAIAVLGAFPAGAGAALSGGLGLDRFAGPQAAAQTSLLAFASAEAAPGDLTVAAVRYDDSRVGAGTAAFVNAGLRVRSFAGLRVVASRSRGDAGYAAWKLRVGPEVLLPSGVTLGAYHMHTGDNSPAGADAVGAELSKAVLPALWAQIGGSLVARDDVPRNLQMSGAVAWRVGRRLQLQGEIDVGRTVVTTTSSSPGGSGPTNLPILRGLGSSQSSMDARTETGLEAAGLLGVRFLFP